MEKFPVIGSRVDVVANTGLNHITRACGSDPKDIVANIYDLRWRNVRDDCRLIPDGFVWFKTLYPWSVLM